MSTAHQDALAEAFAALNTEHGTSFTHGDNAPFISIPANSPEEQAGRLEGAVDSITYWGADEDAKTFKVGDVLTDASGRRHTVQKVTAVRPVDGRFTFGTLPRRAAS